ncbi:MAG: hypothetical protein OXD49_22420 [Candidatus Poribacteria bacterium]|nr:hypothetical protein [Candidatus Poribacteria bacterium]
MSRIYDFFLDIKNNPMDYVGRSSNSDFEKQVINQLEMFGYCETDFNELGNSYRTYWRELIESDDGIIENITRFKQSYIAQPFGTQSYPDILILDNKTVLCLELKSSKGTKPVWNSGLPKANGLYVFGSYVKKDITFFRGCDILNDEDRKRLSGFFENAMKNAESFNQEYMLNQEFGFGVYARKMYQNQQTYNPKAIINFFQNHRRYDLERQVLEYCKRLEHSD